MKFEPKEDIKRIIVVCIAAVIMALNIKSFVRTGGLYPGGATGLALLIQRAGDMFFHVEIPYTVVNVALNAVPVYIGFRYIGKKFTLYSCLMIVLTSVLTDILPGYVIVRVLPILWAVAVFTLGTVACLWCTVSPDLHPDNEIVNTPAATAEAINPNMR